MNSWYSRVLCNDISLTRPSRKLLCRNSAKSLAPSLDYNKEWQNSLRRSQPLYSHRQTETIGRTRPIAVMDHRFFIWSHNASLSFRVYQLLQKCPQWGPPGISLGPPLIPSVYINSLPTYIHSKCNIYPLKMLRRDSSSPSAEDIGICQRNIDTVYRVADSWGLRFNLDKCAVLRCQRGSTDINLGPQHHYIMDTTALSIETAHKDLGITVDCNLKFHTRISKTVKKAAGLAKNLLRSTLS
ncbi:uncharacterized protein LOC143020805 isoform X1 [Oratosquilla oratoria]|uniref:uncharacterized protein LOC143020805 isoform X1 n=1 Tax=Oratosquilla oratoria TaxID=337810 RepID=UPI003F758E56